MSQLNIVERVALAIILTDVSGLCLDASAHSPHYDAVISWLKYGCALLVAIGVLAAPYSNRNRDAHD